jgi:hypothetical protein
MESGGMAKAELQNRCSTTELTRQAFETLMTFLFSSGPRTPFATILLPNVLWAARCWRKRRFRLMRMWPISTQ